MVIDGKDSGEPPRRDDGGTGFTTSYANWSYGTGAAYAALTVPLSQARYIPGMVELPEGSDPAVFTARSAGHGLAVRVPVTWRGLLGARRGSTWWPCLFDFGDPGGRAALNARSVNAALGGVLERAGTTARFALNAPLPASAVADIPVEPRRASPDPRVQAKLTLPGQTRKLVVMAVIDDGLPFAHTSLLNTAGDSTRVDYCWLQSVDTAGNMLFGRKLTRDDINAMRAADGPDEDAIYARAGVIETTDDYSSTLNHFSSHGAHVLTAAAGVHDAWDDLDLMRVILVQLPAPVTIDTASYQKDGPILFALDDILNHAEDIAETYLGDRNAPLPLVINFSYGFSGGPHDGSSDLEKAIAQRIAARRAQGKPTELVLPAGNSFASCMNGEIRPEQLDIGRPAVIPWRLQPNDATSNYLELWLPNDGGGSYELAIADPDGETCAASSPLTFSVGAVGAALTADLSTMGGPTGEVLIGPYNTAWTWARILLFPTEPRNPALPPALSGQWTVTLTRVGGLAPGKPVSCRIQYDYDPYGYIRGSRQSYFDDPADRRYDKGAMSRTENKQGVFVRRYGTVNGLATHDQATVVSSFFADTGRATDYASAGPLTDDTDGPGRVDWSVPADASTALRGALSSGTRSGSAIRLSGTSMAAPLFARRKALEWMTQSLAAAPAAPLLVPVGGQEVAERPIRLGKAIRV